jgi:hypothetical protein
MKRTRIAVAAALAVVTLSFLQVDCSSDRDIRRDAMRGVFDMRRTYFGDPEPSVVAAAQLARQRNAPIYERDLSIGSAFIYPPLAALVYRPLVVLRTDDAHAELALVNHLLLIVIIGLIAAVLSAGGALTLWELLAVLLMTATFYPLLRALELNQAMVITTACLGAAVVSLQHGKQTAAGVALALGALFKPPLALMLPLLFWHARRTLYAALATGAVLLVASLIYAGLANHVAYLTYVLPSMSRGYAYYANQAWNGFVLRLFIGDDSLTVFRQSEGFVAARAVAQMLATSTWVLALVVLRRARDAAPAEAFVFAWLAATLASPIAWEHHYAPAVFAFALWYRRLGGLTPKQLGLLAGAYALMASYFEVRGFSSVALRPLMSYLFAGALLLFGALASLLGDARARI